MTKADAIIDLLASTDLTSRQISECVGCLPAYVRVVQARLLGGGASVADKNDAASFKAKHGVRRCSYKYRTDPEFKARHNEAVRRSRQKRESRVDHVTGR